MHTNYLCKPKRTREKFLSESVDFSTMLTKTDMDSPFKSREPESPVNIALANSNTPREMNKKYLSKKKTTKNFMNTSFN